MKRLILTLPSLPTLLCSGFFLMPVISRGELTESDQAVLKSAETMDIKGVEEALNTYDRLKNAEMVRGLVRILAKRDPNNPLVKSLGGEEMPAEAETTPAAEVQPEKAPAEAEEATTAADALSNAEDARRAKIEGLIAAENFAEAETQARAWRGQSPESGEALSTLAQALLAGNKAQEALNLLQQDKQSRGGKFYPNDTSIGWALLATGRQQEALELAKFIEANPNSYPAGAAADAGTLRSEVEKDLQFKAAEQALDQKDAATARAAVAKLKAAHPKDGDVALLEARLLQLEGRTSEAATLLAELKAKHDKTKPFPAQMDLAGAFLKLGNFEEASTALDEVLSSSAYGNEEKKYAREQRRELAVEEAPSLQISGLAFTADEGDASYARGILSSGWENGRRWKIWSRLDEISLVEEESYINQHERSSFEGGILVNQAFDDVIAGLSVGGTEDHVIAGGSIGRRFNGKNRWNIEGTVNEIVSSSLQLQVLNARQHRIAATAEFLLSPKWYFDTTAHWRQVHLDGDEFGSGYGIEYSLLYTVMEAAGGRPALRIGYMGNVQEFDGHLCGSLKAAIPGGLAKGELEDLPENLMEPRINQHGLHVTLEGNLTESLKLTVGASALYDFHDQKFEYVGHANVNYWLTDRSRLQAGVEYLSSGQGANNDGSIVSGTFGFVYSF